MGASHNTVYVVTHNIGRKNMIKRISNVVALTSAVWSAFGYGSMSSEAPKQKAKAPRIKIDSGKLTTSPKGKRAKRRNKAKRAAKTRNIMVATPPEYITCELSSNIWNFISSYMPEYKVDTNIVDPESGGCHAVIMRGTCNKSIVQAHNHDTNETVLPDLKDIGINPSINRLNCYVDFKQNIVEVEDMYIDDINVHGVTYVACGVCPEVIDIYGTTPTSTRTLGKLAIIYRRHDVSDVITDNIKYNFEKHSPNAITGITYGFISGVDKGHGCMVGSLSS